MLCFWSSVYKLEEGDLEMSFLPTTSTCFDASEALELELSTKHLVYTPPCEHQAKNVCTSKPKTKENSINKVKKKKVKLKYHCSVCGYYGKSKKGIARHNNSKTHQNKINRKGSCHTCVDCNVCKATASSDLTKCPLCSYSSNNTTSLKLHMNVHSTGRPFRCTYCEYTAQNVKELIQHYKTVKKYKCLGIGCVFVSHVEDRFLEHQKSCRWR